MCVFLFIYMFFILSENPPSPTKNTLQYQQQKNVSTSIRIYKKKKKQYTFWWKKSSALPEEYCVHVFIWSIYSQNNNNGNFLLNNVFILISKNHFFASCNTLLFFFVYIHKVCHILPDFFLNKGEIIVASKREGDIEQELLIKY